MFDVIKKLDYGTVAKDYGLKSSTEAMNLFCALMMNPNKKYNNPESYLNSLKWITCYSELDPTLKKNAEERIQKVENSLSKGQTLETGTKVR